jgi:mono/diheme cytochrome c family protein
VVAAAALALAATWVCAQAPGVGDPRGELLYSTYCIGCHTTQTHWREKKLATDWDTLRYQVRRWQRNVAPGLNDEDIAAIARYLNELYYHFPAGQAARPGPASADARHLLRAAQAAL